MYFITLTANQARGLVTLGAGFIIPLYFAIDRLHDEIKILGQTYHMRDKKN